MMTGELNVLVVVAFFAAVAAGIRLVDRLTAPGRDRPRAFERTTSAGPARVRPAQRLVSASPVEKRKPTPGSVST
jgi:hypothetical protein